MTIVESIKTVLADFPGGLTHQQVYNEIIQRKLYSFGAKDPLSVVRAKLRTHCIGIDFPTASKVKHFKIVSQSNSINYYGLIESDSVQIQEPEYTNEEALPEEKIQSAYNEHIKEIKSQIMLAIQNNHPSFFERLIVDLLLNMGYGYDKTSGVVVGGPHDGGIDGIISEDKLGLDLIYLQAKRYSDGNNISRKELQAFIGAMQNVHKGVFITTSSFTEEAKRFAEQQQQKSIKLIDGPLLADLMVRYGVGVSAVTTFSIYRVDSDYFETN